MVATKTAHHKKSSALQKTQRIAET